MLNWSGLINNREKKSERELALAEEMSKLLIDKQINL